MPKRADQKARTHERIVASAARLVRRHGLAGASVPRVMRGAGLTVGGFYAHFRSKRAMDAEVLRTTLSERLRHWFAGLDGADAVAWAARAVKRYLSGAHRDAPEEGCPLPSVLSEIGRADAGTRDAVAEALEAYARELAANLPPAASTTPRERALATLALCVGGLALARAWRGRPSSDEVLRACTRWAVPELRDRD